MSGFPWELFEEYLRNPPRNGSFDAAKLVAPGVFGEPLIGWGGAVVAATGKLPLTFFPASQSHQTVFSDKAHRSEVAVVKPSLAWWAWLVNRHGSSSSSASGDQKGWQLRGSLRLDASTLAQLLGPELLKAAAAAQSSGDADADGSSSRKSKDDPTACCKKGPRVKIEGVSVWAGGGATRTPLHVDLVHTAVFQVAGFKRWLLATEESVEASVEKGHLPEAVLSEGTTDNFLREGSLQEVYGGDGDGDGDGTGDEKHASSGSCGDGTGGGGGRVPSYRTSRVVAGQVVTLRPGDALLVPAGLYHDVESVGRSSSEDGDHGQSEGGCASLSVTVRFTLDPATLTCQHQVAATEERGGPGFLPCCRPVGHWGMHVSEDHDDEEEEEKEIEEAVTGKPATTSKGSSQTAAPLLPAGGLSKTDMVDRGAGIIQGATKQMFQKWREVTSETPETAAATPNTKKMFQKWQEVTSEPLETAAATPKRASSFPAPLADTVALPTPLLPPSPPTIATSQHGSFSDSNHAPATSNAGDDELGVEAEVVCAFARPFLEQLVRYLNQGPPWQPGHKQAGLGLDEDDDDEDDDDADDNDDEEGMPAEVALRSFVDYFTSGRLSPELAGGTPPVVSAPEKNSHQAYRALGLGKRGSTRLAASLLEALPFRFGATPFDPNRVLVRVQQQRRRRPGRTRPVAEAAPLDPEVQVDLIFREVFRRTPFEVFRRDCSSMFPLTASPKATPRDVDNGTRIDVADHKSRASERSECDLEVDD